MSAPPVHLHAGSLFAGEFEVLRPLGEGGMGAVYVVRQISTGVERALKIMHPQLVNDDKLRQRFLQEAKIGAQIESDHVVAVVGAGVDGDKGIPWIAMELLKGETLASAIRRRGPRSSAEVREIYAQLCHALGAAHALGIVHRDLKPENVFLAVPKREGVPFVVKVLDFGIAKLVAEAQTQAQTGAIGTPLWMAPEQTEIGRNISPATDVWSLGLLAFWLFTGQPYWLAGAEENASAMALLREVCFAPLASATERARALRLDAQLPIGFDEWFRRCVDRETSARYKDAREARIGLEELLVDVGPLTTGQIKAIQPPISSDAPTLPSLREPSSVDRLVVATPHITASGAPLDLAKAASPRQQMASPNAASLPSFTPVPVAAPNPATTSAPLAVSPGAPLAAGASVHTTGDLSSLADADHSLPVSRGPRLFLFAAFAAVVAIGAGITVAVRNGGTSTAAAASSSASALASSAAPSASAPRAPTVTFPRAGEKPCAAGMVRVSGGAFFASTRVDTIVVDDFCLDAHEVTTGAFAACVKEKKCSAEGLTGEGLCNYGVKGKERHPINCVDWDQASAFCAAQGKRLPSEDEWAWAARGAEAASLYPWGDDAPSEQLCWSGSADRTVLGTCEIGAHPTGKTPFGAFDLAGNVAEWVTTTREVHQTVRPLLGDDWKSKETVFARDGSGRTSVASQAGARNAHSNTVGFRCASKI
jgi:serine/threonine protein kinase/formylglycine-generating enzyme required for sulfatase activity